MSNPKELMRKADTLFEQLTQADREGNEETDTETLLNLSREHLQVWGKLADAGYVPTQSNQVPWQWEKK